MVKLEKGGGLFRESSTEINPSSVVNFHHIVCVAGQRFVEGLGLGFRSGLGQVRVRG